MSEFKLDQIFCTPLMSFDYGKINDDENQFISKCLESTNENVYNFSSTETYVLDKGLPEIRYFIEKSIRTYVETVVIGEKYDEHDFDFRITQSWLNKTLRNSNGHHIHNHPNSFISGVFYIKVNPNVDSIVFSKPYEGLFQFPIKKYNNFNSYQWTVHVYEGQLLIFPSTLHHEVKPLQVEMGMISSADSDAYAEQWSDGNADRISLSFNVFPTGKIGDSAGLNELRIR